MYHDSEDSGTKSTFKLWKLPNKRCTVAQKKALVDYMSSHIRLARYECDPEAADIEWQHLADTLNRSGTVKTVEAWKVTWRDLRRKAARDQAEARATNCSINEISQRIGEIMADSDEEVIGSNISLSPTQSISIHSLAEESDQDNDLETDMTLARDSLVQSMEVPAMYVAHTRASPPSELESLKGAAESSSDSSPSNSPTPMYKTRCTQDQINALVDCMAINTSMAFGRQNTPKKAGDWKRLRQFLNRMGPAKRTVAWQKTWRDLKRSAVNSGKTKSAYTKPTTKKILDIIEAYTARLKDNPNEFSADDTDLFLPPDGTSVHCATSPACEYLTLLNEDNSMIHETRKHNVSASPARQISSKMSPEHDSVHETGAVSFMQYENENDSDADSEQFKLGKKKKMRCTNAQKFAIVEFMIQHPALATARSHTDGDAWRAEWRQLSKHLNKIGTAKTTASWKRTWRELKKNARCNRASNHKWAEINQKILSLIENTSAGEPADKPVVQTVEDNEPCPTDDMPLLSLKMQSHTDPHTPEIILYEENQSNDIEPSQDRNGQTVRSSEVSPQRHNSMSPQQDSDEDYSLVLDKKEQSLESNSQKAKNARCTPSQINALMNYMARHPSLAKAKCLYMPKGRDPWYSEWRRLTLYLNSLNKMGPAKSTTGWKVTWRSLCLNARRKKSKQCPSYEKVYKKVLEILHEDPPDENCVTVTKVETVEDYPPDPLNCEQAPKYTSIQVIPSVKMSPKQHSSDSHSRGSRMSHVRISDQASPALRSSDGRSPGCSSEVPVHRINRTLPATNEAHANLLKLENQPKPSRERWIMKPRKVRCSNAQLRALADYMLAQPALATDKYADQREPAWLRLTEHLNDLGPARKRTEAWKRTWRDIKNGVRARGRSNQSSAALKRFRELKVRRLIGMASPDRKSGQSDGNMDTGNFTEEYVIPEPEVILTPHAPTPHATPYNFVEIPARSSPMNERLAENESVDRDRQRDNLTAEETVSTNSMLQEMFISLSRSNLLSPQIQCNLSEILRVEDKVRSMEETLPMGTTSLLQMLILEVRRSNELNAQLNSYLTEILKQLRTQKCMHASRHPDSDSQTNHGVNAHQIKQEVSETTLATTIQADEHSSHCNETDDSNEVKHRREVGHSKMSSCSNLEQPNRGSSSALQKTTAIITLFTQIPVQSSPVIRPVTLSDLTRAPKQPYEGMNVQSILQGKVKPATPKGKLVRLKDGTMVLVPENMRMEAAIHDENGESQCEVQNIPQNDQKLEANEDDSWSLKTTELNEC